MDKKQIYLAGDIMTAGSQLARQKELDDFRAAEIDAEVYSPALNKDINDKAAMTEEENNKLAEKITEQDIIRLWNSDVIAICPEQSAIGTMCELGTLYGWKVVAALMQDAAFQIAQKTGKHNCADMDEFYKEFGKTTFDLMTHISNKKVFAHYFDIRTNHLNEKDWRRSFSINQMLYGMILYCTADNTLHSKFEEIIPLIKESVQEVKND